MLVIFSRVTVFTHVANSSVGDELKQTSEQIGDKQVITQLRSKNTIYLFIYLNQTTMIHITNNLPK